MAAPKGNQFWKARSSHGRKPIFENEEQLWKAACEYFKWYEDNPLHEDKLIVVGGGLKKEKLPKMRAMTEVSFCLFLDITRETWDQYKKNKDFTDITEKIVSIIYSQKFEGAAAGMLNSNIIARDLGLADKQDNTHSGPDGNPIEVKSIELVAPSVINDGEES